MENQQIQEATLPMQAAPDDAERLQQACREFADTLGLEEAVPLDVLEAAVRDESYAHNLLASRRSPALLKYLLKHPPGVHGASPAKFSNLELMRRAAGALLRWSKVGFSVADRQTTEQRRAACLACPHLTNPPAQLVYQLTSFGNDQKVCGLCGCKVWPKTRLATETCPDRHPEHTGLSRWGEPMADEAAPE